jgi:hypothetical protein
LGRLKFDVEEFHVLVATHAEGTAENDLNPKYPDEVGTERPLQ